MNLLKFFSLFFFQAPTGNGEWYALWSNNICVKNCIDPNDAACKGLATASDTLYPDAKTCCSNKFSWIDNDLCSKRSIVKTAASGASQQKYCSKPSNATPVEFEFNRWYANDNFLQCVKDCGTSASSDPTCVEVTDIRTKLYASALECCQEKLFWLNSELCVARSEQNGFTDKFYVDYLNSKCLKDCDAASPGCGGSPENLSIDLFDTAKECCEAKLGWITVDQCVNGDTSVGSGKWWVNWNGDKDICIKDCPKGSSDSKCGGLAETWDSKYATAIECCKHKIPWVPLDKCSSN